MVITCSVRKGTSPWMKRSLVGVYANVLVVVASTEVRYALCICGRHVVVRTLLGPAVRQTVQVCTLHVGVGSCIWSKKCDDMTHITSRMWLTACP